MMHIEVFLGYIFTSTALLIIVRSEKAIREYRTSSFNKLPVSICKSKQGSSQIKLHVCRVSFVLFIFLYSVSSSESKIQKLTKTMASA